MGIASSSQVHPTAILAGDIDIDENVVIGPYAILEGNIRVGADSIIRPGASIFGNVNMGQGNQVHTGAVLGDSPQHLKYNNEPTRLEIGDCNVFREHVTIHRGTTSSMETRIGSHNFFMGGSHIAHDCVVGNRCIFANGALVAGHCVIEDNVFLSGNAAVHQFMRVGRLSLLSGNSSTTKDVPPFIIQQGHNGIAGINIVGLRRAGMNHEQIMGIRQSFRWLFREGLILSVAVDRMEKRLGHLDVVQEMISFLHRCKKGINIFRGRLHDEAA